MAGMGCTGRYKENWSRYNGDQVGEGRAAMAPPARDVIEDELRRMNEGKRGHPYEYPDCVVAYAWRMYLLLGKDYRFTEGILSVTLSAVMDRIPDYTTIWRRIPSLAMPDPRPASGYGITVSVDSTGIGLSPRGAWVTEKHGLAKEWMKLHAAVDVLTMKIISFAVTDKRINDHLAVPHMIDPVLGSAEVDAFLGDGAYDNRPTFSYLAERGIRPIIRIRKNSSTVSMGCVHRAAYVREVLAEGGHPYWKHTSGYTMRCVSETVFSMIKGSTGEDARAHTMQRVHLEIAGKVWVHNWMIDARA